MLMPVRKADTPPLDGLKARHFLPEQVVILSGNAVEAKNLGLGYPTIPGSSVAPLLQNDTLLEKMSWNERQGERTGLSCQRYHQQFIQGSIMRPQGEFRCFMPAVEPD
jgi:hypothetical protein